MRVTAEQTGSNAIDVTFHGGPDADAVRYINVSVGVYRYGRPWSLGSYAVSNEHYADKCPVFGMKDDGSTVAVGTTITLGGRSNAFYNIGITDGRDHIIATATFQDGSKRVILDTYV